MSVDFGIQIADLWTQVGPIMGQLWPVIAFVGGVALAFSIGRRIKRFVRP